MSAPSWLDTRMSIGNLITIGTVLAGIVFGWAKFDSRISRLEENTARVETTVERLDRERTDLHTRVVRIEEKLSSQNDTLLRILRNTERQP